MSGLDDNLRTEAHLHPAEADAPSEQVLKDRNDLGPGSCSRMHHLGLERSGGLASPTRISFVEELL